MTFKSKFLDIVPEKFKDPITGLRANTETELSALFCFYHSINAIDWHAVNLYALPYRSTTQLASDYISCSSPFFCEYPLFSDPSTVDNWGGMPADLMAFSKKESKVVLIENKIGSKFTSGGTQLLRQGQYLENSDFTKKVLIVLTSKLFLSKGWYLNEIQDVIDKVADVDVFIMHWEDIFNAINFE